MVISRNVYVYMADHAGRLHESTEVDIDSPVCFVCRFPLNFQRCKYRGFRGVVILDCNRKIEVEVAIIHKLEYYFRPRSQCCDIFALITSWLRTDHSCHGDEGAVVPADLIHLKSVPLRCSGHVRACPGDLSVHVRGDRGIVRERLLDRDTSSDN